MGYAVVTYVPGSESGVELTVEGEYMSSASDAVKVFTSRLRQSDACTRERFPLYEAWPLVSLGRWGYYGPAGGVLWREFYLTPSSRLVLFSLSPSGRLQSYPVCTVGREGGEMSMRAWVPGIDGYVNWARLLGVERKE